MSVDGHHAPLFAFDESRRLTGPNRYFAVPCVVLTALGSLAGDPATHERWRHHVRRICAELQWGDPSALVHRHGGGTVLALVAPEAALLTATEVNEWAWEQAIGAALEAEGFERAHGLDHAAETFADRARDERSGPLARLKAAAVDRGLPWFEDDDAVSIGEGRGSIAWPRAALPLAMDVPWTRLHRVPIALVTGSNGKTTTSRLLADMGRTAGHVVGICGTDGVTIAGDAVDSGDYSGPAGARLVLRDARVDLAVLETARGGILRRGLAMRTADVAVVTNISEDHLGEYGIANVHDIAEVKLVVARVLGSRGTLVLNAADEVLMAAAARLPHAAAATQALFALDPQHPRLQACRAAGGLSCTVDDAQLLLLRGEAATGLGEIGAMPLTVGGAAAYNIENAAAATLAAAALGLPDTAIRETLARFGAKAGDNPGRLERYRHQGAEVLIDYAHNPDGLGKLLAVARSLAPRRLLLLLGQAGNRDDEAIVELGRTAARYAPDRVMLKEMTARYLRGRSPGEVPALLTRGLIEGHVPIDAIQLGGGEEEAALRLLSAAAAGDVVVLAAHDALVRERLARQLSG